MKHFIKYHHVTNYRINFIALFAMLLSGISFSAIAQSNQFEAPAIVPIISEPRAKLIVDAPIAEALAKGKVIVQYRTQNLRIVAVYGEAAKQVSPRIGHLHVTVDNLPWHWADASNEPIIIVGMKPGPHTILLEIADTTHHVLDSHSVSFVVPDIKMDHNQH